MQSGIYAILNLVNGKCYIGSAKNFRKRWYSHHRNLNKNEHENSYLQKAWNKYKQLNFIFVILEFCEFKILIEREQFYIDTLMPEYNLAPTAGSMAGFVHSEESKNKNRIAHLHRKHNEQARKNMSASSANRNKEKWPHKLGARCKCTECKEKWKTRDREHMREWREYNKDRHNAYMRDYQRKLRLKKKLEKAKLAWKDFKNSTNF
jgi:group I intron endonuclease